MRLLVSAVFAFGMIIGPVYAGTSIVTDEPTATSGSTFLVSNSIHIILFGIASDPVGDRGQDATDRREITDMVLKRITRDQKIVCSVIGRVGASIAAECFAIDQQTNNMTDLAALLVRLGVARDCPALSGGKYSELETNRSREIKIPDSCFSNEAKNTY